MGTPMTLPVDTQPTIHHILKAQRPKHWLKNTLVFAPLVIHSETDVYLYLHLGLVFICFTLCAGWIYILNDMIDVKEDSCSTTKKVRPFASGALSICQGNTILTFQGLCILLMIILDPLTRLTCALYLALSVMYCLFIRSMKYLDMLAVVSLHLVRLVPGFILIYDNVDVLDDLILTGLFTLSVMCLVLSKRQSEITVSRRPHSKRPYKREDAHKLQLYNNILLAVNFAGVIGCWYLSSSLLHNITATYLSALLILVRYFNHQCPKKYHKEYSYFSSLIHFKPILFFHFLYVAAVVGIF